MSFVSHKSAPTELREIKLALLYSDIASFTQLTERLGDRGAYDVAAAHFAIVQRETVIHGGLQLEQRGDGVLLAFSSALDALNCAVAIQRALEPDGSDSDDVYLLVHMGLHWGPVLYDGQRIFGRELIVAARIADIARPREILVSSAFRALVEGDKRLCPQRAVYVKGFAGQLGVSRFDWWESPPV